MAHSFKEDTNRLSPMADPAKQPLTTGRFNATFALLAWLYRPKAAYSAASASLDFGFAAEIMKSVMRGMVSERKREPLNTP